MVLAYKNDELDELVGTPVFRQRFPELIRHIGRIMERVDEANEKRLARRPGRIARRAVNRRPDPRVVKTHGPGESSHVNPPFVLRAASGTYPVDDQLTVAGI